MPAIDARLKQLIFDYQDAVHHAVAVLEAAGIPRPKSTADWVGYDIPQIGELPNGGKYFIHGFGCAVKTPNLRVDFDFGENGEIDGIDYNRMVSFAAKPLRTTYGIADEIELKQLFKDASDAGDLIDSGYILWYLSDELRRNPTRKADEQSDARKSPVGREFES